MNKGMWLSCLVLVRGIEASLGKIDAILNMEPPTSRKLAQRLARRLIGLNRFISRSTVRGLPFFEVVKKHGPIQLRTYDNLKAYLHNITTLASPQPSEPLLLYVATSPHVVSAVLVREKQEKH